MIRKSLSCLALSACIAQASVGDWQAWTYTKSPVMATVSRGGVWTASSGGAVFYDTLTDKSQTYTNLNGLPSTNLVGIHSMADGTIWSIAAQGDLAKFSVGASRWSAVGSYRQSGWKFSPRCITSWNDSILLVGGPSGLSLFSTKQGLALDNISSFGSLRQETVTGILVEKDTIWVGLTHGAAFAVPNWNRIGKAGNFLADPTKWTVIAKTGSPVKSFFRWAPNTPMNIDTVYASVRNTDGDPTISSGFDLYWNGKAWSQFNPVHTVPAGRNLVMCLPGSGVKILRPDGTTRTLKPPVGMPQATANRILFRKSGSLAVWVGANEIVDLPTSLNSMTSLTTSAGLDLGEEIRSRPSFRLNPEGNLVLAPWGVGLISQTSTGWNLSNASNSCIATAAGANTDYPAITAISNPTSTGNWFGFFSSDASQYLGFLKSSQTEVSCYPYSSGNVRDLAAEGDSALWITSDQSLFRYRTQPSLALDKSFSISKINSTYWSGDRLYFAGDFLVGRAIPRQGTIFTKTNNSEFQTYKHTEIDGLGNLWASSDHGVDVMRINDSSVTMLAHIDTSSGLLSNNVLFFALQPETGLAAIVTDLGLNLYQSPFKSQPETIDRNKVHPFPNPYRKQIHSNYKVAFPGVRSTSELFIYASDGALINHQVGADVIGDQFLWTPKANLRPGLYFWIITDPSSSNIKGRLIVSD